MAVAVECDVILEVPFVDAQPPGFAIGAGFADLVALLVGDRRRKVEAALIHDVVQSDEHAVDESKIVLILQADDLLATAGGQPTVLKAGGTVVNYTWCFRPPDWVRREWKERFGLDDWAGKDFDDSLDAVRGLDFTDEELAAIERHAVDSGINLWKPSSDS